MGLGSTGEQLNVAAQQACARACCRKPSFRKGLTSATIRQPCMAPGDGSLARPALEVKRHLTWGCPADMGRAFVWGALSVLCFFGEGSAILA